MFKKRYLKDMIRGPAHIFYHVGLIVLSASIALLLPYTADFIAREFLTFWALIGDEKIFLVSVEISFAIALILFFNYVGRVWRDRRLSGIARKAGLVSVSSSGGFLARRKNRRLKESHGIARDIKVIGSTGFRTFADENGDLHAVLKNCREAKIMLLNPHSEGASLRVKSILDPDITLARFREQIGESIDFLKGLKAGQKNIKLKLYDEVPFLKMAISGDHIWVKHYHAEFDVQSLPEYVLRYNQNPGSLYVPFYQYFLRWWNDPGIPEYDLESDELIYRDVAGNEERREKFRERADSLQRIGRPVADGNAFWSE
jgi:hypothetical protein